MSVGPGRHDAFVIIPWRIEDFIPNDRRADSQRGQDKVGRILGGVLGAKEHSESAWRNGSQFGMLPPQAAPRENRRQALRKRRFGLQALAAELEIVYAARRSENPSTWRYHPG
jgi:hypothetical protein